MAWGKNEDGTYDESQESTLPVLLEINYHLDPSRRTKLPRYEKRIQSLEKHAEELRSLHQLFSGISDLANRKMGCLFEKSKRDSLREGLQQLEIMLKAKKIPSPTENPAFFEKWPYDF